MIEKPDFTDWKGESLSRRQLVELRDHLLRIGHPHAVLVGDQKMLGLLEYIDARDRVIAAAREALSDLLDIYSPIPDGRHAWIDGARDALAALDHLSEPQP
jgi:hypothetical protein